MHMRSTQWFNNGSKIQTFVYLFFQMLSISLAIGYACADTVQTVVLESSAGLLKGQTFELPDGSTGSKFLGIRYANAPIGEKRFRAPEAADPWDSIYDATRFGPSCYQPELFDVWMMSDQPLSFSSLAENLSDLQPNSFQSSEGENSKRDRKNYMIQDYLHDVNEDCLSVNVYTPLFKNETDQDTLVEDRKPAPSRRSVLRKHKNTTARRTKGTFEKSSNPYEYIEIDSTTSDIQVALTEDTDHDEWNRPYYSRGADPEMVLRDYKNELKTVQGEQEPRKPHYIPDGIWGRIVGSEDFKNDRIKRSQKSNESDVNPPSLEAEVKDEMENKYLKDQEYKAKIGGYKFVRAPTHSKLPVMVYVHGGSYFGNAGRMYPGEKLASTGMIVVTLNYRLGPFGFLSTGDSAARGNYGLLDQRMALEWVKAHISSFGGDPGRVLLAGNSAGGASVLLHLLSPGSLGLFSRVAGMSGSTLGPWAIQRKPRKFAEMLGNSANCTGTSEDLVRCLRDVNPEDIMKKVTDHLSDGLWISYAAVVEGPWGPDAFLPHHPFEVFNERNFTTDVPVFLTFTEDEVSIWYRQTVEELKLFQIESWIGTIVRTIYSSLSLSSANMDAMIHSVRGVYLYSLGYKPTALNETPEVQYDHPAYTPKQAESYPWHFPNDTAPVSIIAKLISDVGLLVPCIEEAGYLAQITEVFMAQFSFISPDDVKIEGKSWIGAYHEHELQYLFGLPYWNLENSLQDPANKIFSNTIMTIFKQFADLGYPYAPNSTDQWPQYKRPGDGVLNIGELITVKYNYHLDRVAFWNQFIPLLTKWPIQPSENCSSAATSNLIPTPNKLCSALSDCTNRGSFNILTELFGIMACIPLTFAAMLSSYFHTTLFSVGR